MITILSGAPGAGKSSLDTYFLKRAYFSQGRTLLDSCTNKIAELNKTRLNPLTPPDKPPIFSDYKVKFRVGYDEFFEPYYINGYYLGLANDRMATQFLPPYSKVFLGEAHELGQTFFYDMAVIYGLNNCEPHAVVAVGICAELVLYHVRMEIRLFSELQKAVFRHGRIPHEVGARRIIVRVL